MLIILFKEKVVEMVAEKRNLFFQVRESTSEVTQQTKGTEVRQSKIVGGRRQKCVKSKGTTSAKLRQR
jgi:hypothetical protein